MSTIQNLFIYIFTGILAPTFAFAISLEGSSSSVSFNYACVGIDGAPIPVGSSMATLCCDSNMQLKSPPDPTCMAGFNSINVDAVQGTAVSITLALNILTAANNMNGSVNNNDMVTSVTPAVATASVPSVQALGATAAVPGYGNSGTSSGTLANTQSSSGGSGGAGGGAGGGGGGGLSLGAASNTAANQANAITDSGNSIDGARVAYVQGNGDKAGGGGFNFGSKDAGISKDGADTINLGDETNGKSRSLADEDGVGVSDDPADYFKRTDRSTNLFKIVSNRYFKKKSLWKVKQ